MRQSEAAVRPVLRVPLLAFLLCIVCCLLTVGSCDMKPSTRSVSEQIRIEPEWTEIRPEPPLEVRKQVQRISIDVPNLTEWDVRTGSASFVMPDGTPTKIDVELIAADGTRFTLDSVGMGPGLTFSYLPADPDATGSRLPSDMTFATIRVRSNAPFDAERVSWVCITNY